MILRKYTTEETSYDRRRHMTITNTLDDFRPSVAAHSNCARFDLGDRLRLSPNFHDCHLGMFDLSIVQIPEILQEASRKSVGRSVRHLSAPIENADTPEF